MNLATNVYEKELDTINPIIRKQLNAQYAFWRKEIKKKEKQERWKRRKKGQVKCATCGEYFFKKDMVLVGEYARKCKECNQLPDRRGTRPERVTAGHLYTQQINFKG